jgi:hypothetical protein
MATCPIAAMRGVPTTDGLAVAVTAVAQMMRIAPTTNCFAPVTKPVWVDPASPVVTRVLAGLYVTRLKMFAWM